MNDTQKYLFDLQGFLVVEDVLCDADCDLAIDKIKQRMKPMEKTPNGTTATAPGTRRPTCGKRVIPSWR